MITKEIIDKAILAHSKWKTRLKELIEGKSPDFDINKAGTDNNCEFGKWIYGDTIEENERKSDYYTKVKSLHADFHKSVKEVADLVISGKNEDARKLISDYNSPYNKTSTHLTLLLADWEKKFKI